MGAPAQHEVLRGQPHRPEVADRRRQDAAPLLSGVWASAPYFVNGSVPTIRDLLEPADKLGVATLVGSLLQEGTTTRKSEEIAQLIEEAPRCSGSRLG